MTPRSIRRAAERKAAKKARKAANLLANAATAASFNLSSLSEQNRERSESAPDLTDSDTPINSVSPAQLAANRENAQLSTGAKTPEGKAASSLNAVTNALTGRTVLLRTDDAAAYQAHVAAYQKDFQPVGQRESDLVQSIADCAWRLHRIAGLELSIFAKGTLEFADSFNEHDASLRPGLIELETFLTYEKQLRNLHIQEARLSRRREREITELRKLQGERKTKEVEALDLAASHYVAAKHRGTMPQLSANGFEFSTAQIENYLKGVPPSKIAQWAVAPYYQPAATSEIAIEQAA